MGISERGRLFFLARELDKDDIDGRVPVFCVRDGGWGMAEVIAWFGISLEADTR